jgi:hypothetical protein
VDAKVIFVHKQRYGPTDFIGQRCMEMLNGMFPHALNAKNWNIS